MGWFLRPRGLRRGSAAARLLGLRVRIPPNHGLMYVSCECYVLSGRGLCDGAITNPEESYRVWCVWVWSRNLKQWSLSPVWLSGHEKKLRTTRATWWWKAVLRQHYPVAIHTISHSVFRPNSSPGPTTSETPSYLTLIVLMWRIGWAHNNARK